MMLKGALPQSETMLPDHGEHVYSDRICGSAETLERVMPLLERYGITRVARVTGLDRLGIPVWNAVRPNAKSLSIHQGKGITDDDARASATMEAIERAVAEEPTILRVTASRAELTAAGVDHDPLESLLGYRQVGPADDEDIEWVSATNLIQDLPILVPLDAVAIDRTRESRYWQSSDGLASGNNRMESTFHGLLERVERDADTLWSVGRREEKLRSRFDHAALGDPVVDRLVAMIEAAGLRLVLFDLTSDLGLPVVSALLGPSEDDQPTRYIDVAGGSGAHPVTARAAIRAITEAAQSRLTLINGARDDIDPRRYADAISPSLLVDLASPPRKSPPRDAGYAGTDEGLLKSVIDAIGQHTDRIYVTDLTPNESRFSVVKILIPDLENPDGARRQRYGIRALTKLMVF